MDVQELLIPDPSVWAYFLSRALLAAAVGLPSLVCPPDILLIEPVVVDRLWTHKHAALCPPGRVGSKLITPLLACRRRGRHARLQLPGPADVSAAAV